MPRETAITEQKASFAAEVISGFAASHRPGAVELKLRLLQGKPSRGAAQLVEKSGATHDVTILGITQVTYSQPTTIEPGVIYLGVSGVAAEAIQAGQKILQE